METDMQGNMALMSGANVQPDQVDPNAKYFFNWQETSVRVKKLLGSWSGEISATEDRRSERYIDVDINQMRESGQIGPDETFIPVRVIDTNVTREEPAYSSYLTQSRRLAIFKSNIIGLDTEKLAIAFTEGVRYQGWFRSFHRVGDGARTHGWDFMEVSFDVSKPHHVAYEHVGHDKLFFDKDIEDFQESELVIRQFQATSARLEYLVSEFGFDANQVSKILNRNGSAEREFDKRFDIYRLYFKYQQVVYVAWFTDKYGADNWLKAPIKLRLGIQRQEMQGPDLSGMPMLNIEQMPMMNQMPQTVWVDEDITEYPLFPLVYKETEEKEITKKVGRCFLDGDWQEAQTALVSSYVNGCIKASNVLAAPENNDEAESTLRQLDITLENGVILSKPMKFFHMDYPDPMLLGSIAQLDSKNSAAAGQVDYAAVARKDSRKSATELNQAQQEADLLKSTPLTLYSDHIRAVFSFAWKIVQSQALQNKIRFLVNEQTGANDIEVISQEYEIFPAGDVDVVQRQEKITQMMQDWPVVSNTALATRFLTDLMKLKYPDVGDQYAAILEAGDPMKATIVALATTLKGALQPEEYNALPPESQMQLNQLQQQVGQLTGQQIQIVPTNEPQPGIPGSNQTKEVAG